MSLASEIIESRIKKLFPGSCEKILLILPPETIEQNFSTELILNKRIPSYPPYSCGILARNLKEHHYTPEIIDLNFILLCSVHENTANFNYRIWEEKLSDKINEFQPDFIGISTLFTIAHESMVNVIQYVKKKYPKIPIIVGGVNISNDTEKILRVCPEIDFGMFSEGDVAFPDFIDVINKKLPIEKISHIAILDNNQFVSTNERISPVINYSNIKKTQPDYLDLPVGDYSKYGAIGAYNFFELGT